MKTFTGDLAISPTDPDQQCGDVTTSGRVLVVDEHALTATGLQLALAERLWDVETSSGPTGADVIEDAREFRAQCVVLDVRLGDEIGSGIDLIEPLVATGAHVVMLTAERRRSVLAECLLAGAAGWIGKDTSLDELDTTLGRLMDGGTVIGETCRAQMLHDLRLEREREFRTRATFDQLTEREALVLAALSDGLSADEIAQENYVALTTVRSQIRAVLKKLDVRSQIAAVAVAARHRDLLPRRGNGHHDRRRSLAPDRSEDSLNIA